MEVSARIARLALAETFRISRETTDEAAVIQVEIRHGRRSATARLRRSSTTTSPQRLRSPMLESNADALGDDPWALDAIHGRLPRGEPAARSALDAALHDLCGKLAGVPRLEAPRPRAGTARRPRGRSGSATRTRWPARPSATRPGSGG